MDVPLFLKALPVWLINGVLITLYWFMAHISEWISIVFAALIAFGFDPLIQGRAAARPRRYDRGDVQTAAPNAQYFTLATLLVWLAVSLGSQNPIPLIGACLWGVGFVGILAISEQRFNQLWWAKVGILVYAGVVLLFRYGLSTLHQVQAAEWASVIGSSADAQAILGQTRNNVAAMGLLFTFVIYPLGYTGMLLNRFFRNPKSLVSVFAEAGDVIRKLRVRT